MIEIGENVSKSAPRVSVVIPAYKVTLFIEETLQSVFAQTFTDYETIVINDGSPDTNEFEAIIK
ncbi:MAG: glycosyltransferase, partial [Pyrinomonadaceae bacterium]|nr:glycosyltransferase [Pyrinomonadaceae bacterium]